MHNGVLLLGGAALGLAYTLSPLTVWCLVALAALAAAAAVPLSPRERAMLLGLLGAAILARAVLVGLYYLASEPSTTSIAAMFGDELHLKRRSLWLRNIALGIPVMPSDFFEAYALFGRSGVNYLFAGIQTWLGPAPYALHLLSTTFFMAAALALHQLARRAFGRLAAMGGLAVLLFVPTLIVWSSAVLKETSSILATAVTVAAAGSLPFVHGRRRLVAFAILIVAIWAGHQVRRGALEIALGGLVAGGVVYATFSRPWTRRAAAVAALGMVVLVAAVPTVAEPVTARLRAAARTHLAHVQSPGHSYRLLDSRFYDSSDPPLESMTHGEAARFALRAAASFVAVPVPWDTHSRTEVLLIPQQMTWYLVIALAVPGAVVGFRRSPWVMSMLLGTAAVGAAAIAVHTGNVGTLVRLRDTVVPLVVWPAAIGFETTARWLVGRGSART